MDFKLIWTDRAISVLEEVVRYYREEQQSIDAARKVGAAIVDHVGVIKSLALSGMPDL